MSRSSRCLLGLTLGLVLGLAGCGGEGDDALVEVERPGDLFQVVDRSDQGLGQAAVVRVTPDWIVALTLLPEGKPLAAGQRAPARYLRVGDEQLPAVVRACGGGLSVIQARRGDREARPFGLLNELSADQTVEVRGVGGEQLSTRLSPAPAGAGFQIAEGAAWSGAVVLRGSRLAGFLQPSSGDDEPSRLLTISGSLARTLPVVCSPPGSDMLGPGDGFSAIELALRSPPSLPPLEDDWGEADFFLALDDPETKAPVARLHLVPGRHLRPQLITIPNLGPLQARLVERDVSLTEGVVDTPLAPGQIVDPRSGAARLRFELEGGARVTLGLRLRVLDPDRASAFDRTPLGAKVVRLSDAKRGRLTLTGGDATDHWRFEALPSRGEPGPVPRDLLLLAFRADPTLVTLEGWLPGAAGPSWRLPSEEGAPRLIALRLEVPGVRQWIRARQDRVREPSDPKLGIPSTYAFAVASRTEPRALAGLLLELLVGEAQREGATYLSAPSLARETLRALSEVAGASRADLTEAFLPGLGYPEPAARLLVLELLSTHLAPDEVALERLRREARGPARRTDAGLLLVSRLRSPRRLAEVELALRLEDRAAEDPNRDDEAELQDPLERRAAEVARVWRALPSSERDALVRAASDAMGEFLLRGASDPLPEIRVRAITLAAGVQDPALRLRLRERLESRLHQDPSPRVRRALLTAFWSRD